MKSLQNFGECFNGYEMLLQLSVTPSYLERSIRLFGPFLVAIGLVMISLVVYVHFKNSIPYYGNYRYRLSKVVTSSDWQLVPFMASSIFASQYSSSRTSSRITCWLYLHSQASPRASKNCSSMNKRSRL